MNGASTSADGGSRANLTVFMLLIIYTLNYLDRQIINIVAEPIKIELHLQDWQLGLLTGLAFALFYTFLGIPLARLADDPRTHRPTLIAACLAIWSGMTAVCGLAGSYVQLLAARVGVAVGEAGCSPASHSLISEAVPAERRASALAIFSMGIPLGKLFGLLIGGVIAHELGWRMSFILVGGPGMLVALFAWRMLPEPRRAAHRAVSERRGPTMVESLRLLLPQRTFWLVTLGGAFMSFLSFGQTAFLGSFLMRVHHVNVGQAGIMLGLSLGISGAAGTWAGGRICDRMGARSKRAFVIVPSIAAAAGGLLFVVAMAVDNLVWALAALTAASGLISLWYGPVFATVQGVVQPSQRAMAAAVHLFVLNLIAVGLGPLMFGLLSDALNHGVPALMPKGLGPAEGLRYALMCGSLVVVIAIACFALAARTIEQDLAGDS